jgi:small-conductance mechanosensitive channel
MALVDQLEGSFAASFDSVSSTIALFLPKLFLALVIFVLGWIVGAIVGRFIAQVISALRIDKAMARAGVDTVITRAGFRLNTGLFVGKIVEWFIMIVFLIAALDILGLSQVNIFLVDTVLGYLPNVLVATLILVIAAVLSDVAYKLVVGSAKAARLPSAHFLGGIAKWAIWVFAIIAALDHLGIATSLLETLFTGLVYMLTIAGGLAFGLGGKEAAAHFIQRLRGDISGK